MPERTIRIDETAFTLSSGSPFKFTGVHSGSNLSGIDLNISAYSDVEAHQIEELLKKDTVEIEDPFADRQYEAILTRKSSGYQEGHPEKWYHLEVKELDEATPFESLEIEGHTFTVIKNSETDDVVGLKHFIALVTGRVSRVPEHANPFSN